MAPLCFVVYLRQPRNSPRLQSSASEPDSRRIYQQLRYCLLLLSRRTAAVYDLHLLKDYSDTGTSQIRDQFRIPLLQRDEEMCIFFQAHADPEYRTDVRPNNLEAAHFIPHCKGDEYIRILQEIRRVPRSLWLDGVDDIRNGAILWNELHREFAYGNAAFLLVPNIYMSVEDAPPGPPERLDWPPEGDDEEFTSPNLNVHDDLDECDGAASDKLDGYSDYIGSQKSTETVELAPIDPAETVRARREQQTQNIAAQDPPEAEINREEERRRREAEEADSGYIPMAPQSRLVLQYLAPFPKHFRDVLPNKTRAALHRWTRLSPVALHAVYACSIVNKCGTGIAASDGPSISKRKIKDNFDDDEEGPKKRKETRFSRNDGHPLRTHVSQYYPYRAASASHQTPTQRSNDEEVTPMDKAWDFLLAIHMPPARVLAEHAIMERRKIEEWRDGARYPVGV